MKLRKGTIHKAINPETGRVLSVKGAKTKAWTAFARFIRARDPRCVSCGAPTTEAGHYFPNSDKPSQQLGGNELWYHEQNVNGQCGTCNRWMSGNLSAYAVYLIEKYGSLLIPRMNVLYRTPKKWTIEELLAIEAKYTSLYEQLVRAKNVPKQNVH